MHALLSILLLFTFPNLSEVNLILKSSDHRIETTTTGIGLGRKKKNCNKKGICVIGSDIKIIDDRHTIAKLGFSNGALNYMFISYSDLTESALKFYFSGSHFIMEEAFRDEITLQNKKYDINLEAGKYRIQKESKGFKIIF